MTPLTLQLNSIADTDRLGTALAHTLPAGTTLSLVGPLGAGKTRLVQAVAAALGNPADDITSPTFVLVNEYTSGRMPVYHFDAYRLKDDDEFLQLGPDEYFEGAGLTFVEWGNRVADCLPRNVVEVQIEVLDGQQRLVRLHTSDSELSQQINHRMQELPTE